jgi:hypothetical protein
MTVERIALDGGAVRFQAGNASFTIMRVRPGVVLAIGGGHDKGDFGDAVLQEFEREIKTSAPIEIFCDTTDVFNASQVVFERWASWLQENRSNLKAVNVLTGSKLTPLRSVDAERTASVRVAFTSPSRSRSSGTGELMRIYTDARPFEEAIAREIGKTFSLAEARKRLSI